MTMSTASPTVMPCASAPCQPFLCGEPEEHEASQAPEDREAPEACETPEAPATPEAR
jgi:hypothetical protein